MQCLNTYIEYLCDPLRTRKKTNYSRQLSFRLAIPVEKSLYKVAVALFFVLSPFVLLSQELHDSSCGTTSASFSLDWSASPGAGEVNWAPSGNLSYTATDVQGSGYDINFVVSGQTGTLTAENGVNTPGVTSTLSGGEDALTLSSTGLDSLQEIRLTMNFSPSVVGQISFDIYNIIQQAVGGAGQMVEVYGVTTAGYIIIPELVDNGSPSFLPEGPGSVDGNSSNTTGTNDQLGVNFRSIANVASVVVVMRQCTSCGNASNTEIAIGDIDFCLSPDQDQDGVSDLSDQDDDNDGIPDATEKCASTAQYTFDWDNYTWPGGTTASYAMPDNTQMTVSAEAVGGMGLAYTINQFLAGGNNPVPKTLLIAADQDNLFNSIDVTLDFSEALDNVSFEIFDVDFYSAQYADSVIVTGYYNGFVAFPTMTASPANTVSTNTAIGVVNVDDNGPGSENGTVTVQFSDPIDSVVIFYTNGTSSPFHPLQQWIGIHDITYIGDCGSNDTDGDGIDDYLDIDADNDGIVDYIEWQASSATPIQPAGTDSDGDGIDDNFELLGAPVDTDNDGVPDFQDLDSDNDGDPDILEGWDTDNDGIADTSPSGVDADFDGLDDAFDEVAGLNSTTNVTNNGQVSENFPDLDDPASPERDWREALDRDRDNVPDYADEDEDNDGIPDVDEGCADLGFSDTLYWEEHPWPTGQVNSTFSLDGLSVTFNAVSNGGTPSMASSGILTGGASPVYNSLRTVVNQNTYSNSVTYSIDLSEYADTVLFSIYDVDADLAGTGSSNKHRDQVTITGYLNGGTVLPSLTGGTVNTIAGNVATATDAGTSANTSANTSNAGNVSVSFTSPVDSIVVIWSNAPLTAQTNPSSQELAFSPFLFQQTRGTCDQDSDGDGILDYLDLDADNDGLFDLHEAGHEITVLNSIDTDEDGIIDASVEVGTNGFADSLETVTDNGLSNYALQDKDADGIPDYLDLDSDNDGITDLAENGNGTDVDNDGIVDGTTDADGDGILSSADSDEASVGSPGRMPEDMDADGLFNSIDLDADNDGMSDHFESGSGTDADEDGTVDGAADADGDGILDSADNNDGLTGSPGSVPLDSDGDGKPDAFDIDADDDGIVDIIEAQVTTDTPTIPLGTDTDNDGIDDAFDEDQGGAFLVPVNTDGADDVDYLDSDTDNDGEDDLIEGWDTNGDGTAETEPSGSDADNDGLDDNFDDVAGPVAVTNTTNGQTALSFPNVDGGLNERDWREVPCDDGTVVLAPDDATTTASGYCMATYPWTYYYSPVAPSELLFAIQRFPFGGNTNDFAATIDITVSSNPLTEAGVYSSTDVGNELATFAMGRYFNVSGATLNGAVNIRFYYRAAEADTLQAVAERWNDQYAGGTAFVSGLRWFMINSGTFEPAPPDMIASGLQSVTEVFPAVTGTEDGVAFVQFNGITSLTGGGLAYTIGNNSIVLPVELLGFNAEKAAGQVYLDWSTASENNSDYFEVQHSVDKRNWHAIANVPAAGFSSEIHSYNAWHRQPSAGINYYRLRQVDFNGAEDFSEVREVNFEALEEGIRIFPNPAKDMVRIHVPDPGGAIIVELISQTGQIVKRTAVEASRAISYSLSLDRVPTGTYTVRVISGKKVEHLPLIISK